MQDLSASWRREARNTVEQEMLREREARKTAQGGPTEEVEGDGDPAEISVGDTPSWEKAAGAAIGTAATVAGTGALIFPALTQGSSAVQAQVPAV